jgi:hypothetical protein
MSCPISFINPFIHEKWEIFKTRPNLFLQVEYRIQPRLVDWHQIYTCNNKLFQTMISVDSRDISDSMNLQATQQSNIRPLKFFQVPFMQR